jgi:hypothetical protein
MKTSSPLVIIDLTTAYKKFAGGTVRGVAMVGNRRAVLVQDEFDLEKLCEVTWAMTTDAQITTKTGGTAVLTLGGRKLIARVLSPADTEFTVESAEQKHPQKVNKGVSRLVVRLPQTKGNVRVAVLLSPVWKDGDPVRSVRLRPLAEW